MGKIWKVISLIFGLFVFADGILNLFWGNDFGLGVAFVFLSFVYFPFTNSILKKSFGFAIPPIVKIILGILIVWVTLAVGAFAEGYLPF